MNPEQVFRVGVCLNMAECGGARLDVASFRSASVMGLAGGQGRGGRCSRSNALTVRRLWKGDFVNAERTLSIPTSQRSLTVTV